MSFLDEQRREEDRRLAAARELELARQAAIGVCGVDFVCDSRGNRLLGALAVGGLGGLAGLAPAPMILAAAPVGIDLAKVNGVDPRNPASLIGLDGATIKYLQQLGLIGNDGSTFTAKALLGGTDLFSLIGNDGSTLVGNRGIN